MPLMCFACVAYFLERKALANRMYYGKESFQKFYYETYDELVKYVKRMGGLEHLAEDIVQESYYTAYREWKELSMHPNQKGWLYITANYISKNLRRRMENQNLSLEALEESVPQRYAASDFETVEWNLTLQKKFPEKESRLICRYYLEGRSTAEIAEELGISNDYVRVKLSRLRKKLREELKKSYDTEKGESHEK